MIKPLSAKLFLQHHTKANLNALVQRPSHATLLYGEVGTGLASIARWFANEIDAKHISFIEPDEKGTISIDSVRDLYQSTRSKQEKRAIIIDDADALTHAAQNALLKLLEEPTPNIYFILTTHNKSKLLPTIISRTQLLRVLPIGAQDTETMLDMLGITDKTLRSQLLFMALGKPAAIHRLLQDKTYFSAQVQLMTDAKHFLQGPSYEKLLIVQKYAQNRKQALQLLDAAVSILRFTIQKNFQSQLIGQLEAILHAQERISENGHIKTQLLNVALS